MTDEGGAPDVRDVLARLNQQRRERPDDAGQPLRGEPMIGADGKPSRWWRRGPRTRRHRYYYPVDNRPGMLLFALATLLGLAAMVIAASHGLRDHGFARNDRTLGLIGMGMVVLGLWQLWTLARPSSR